MAQPPGSQYRQEILDEGRRGHPILRAEKTRQQVDCDCRKATRQDGQLHQEPLLLHREEELEEN